MLQQTERKAERQKEIKKEITGGLRGWWRRLKERGKVLMSKKYPECPLYDHSNCKKIDKPDVCAIVRADKQCLKKRKNPDSKK